MGSGERTWRVGDVAVATGLTVRALHHYDGIGLVAPSGRTVSGHRLYTEADLRRLYMVTALRQLGLSLEQVGKVLAADLSVRDVIDEQLEQVERQIRTAQRLREQLLAAREASRAHADAGAEAAASEAEADGADTGADAGADASRADTEASRAGTGPGLMAVIKLTQDMRSYLSTEQIEAMHRRMTELGVVAEHAVGVEMPSLYGEALAEMRAGTPSSDQTVRRIVDRLDELSRLLRGSSDQGTGPAVRRMWLERGRQNPDVDGGGEWVPLVAYLDAARAAR